MRVVLLIYLSCLSGAAFAHVTADGDIYAAAGAFTYTTHATHGHFKNPVSTGPAISAEADIGPHAGVEISMFYLDNVFAIHSDGMTFAERLKRIYITTGYRYWFVPQFSAALALSSSYSMGNARPVQNDFGNLNHPGTSATDTTEYGFELSLQYEPITVGRFSLVLDTRYNFSVTPKHGEDENHYGAMISVKYFVQSRDHARPEF